MPGTYRLGTTSYIMEAGLLENAHYLAGKVQDMELVLFDREDGQCNLPSAEEVTALKQAAQGKDLSYTVHLPEDLRWKNGIGEPHPSLAKARKAILSTQDLQPLAYVAHLDGRGVDWQSRLERKTWEDQALKALEMAAVWAGGWQRIALENLEGFPLRYLDEIFARVPVSGCLDIGHLWVDGWDAAALLSNGVDWPRVRVVHLHGIAPQGRDHHSLAFQPHAELAAVFDLLARNQFSGVLTLEVFGEEDFLSSLQVVQNVLAAQKEGGQ
ncbi:MAG: sugar phosphate isomerase/epimerase [Chloroflexi bacterium]|nr:sugar phosphate isomerase/epimerase [Chloroflexota bacterium]